MAYATHKGIFAAAGNDKIILGSIVDLKNDVVNEESTFKTNRHEIEIQGVTSIGFTRDEANLVIANGSTLQIAPINDYNSLTSTAFQKIEFQNEIDLFTPSPTNPSKIAVLTKNGEFSILDVPSQSQSTIATDVLNFSWSPKGKQIAIAKTNGSINQITLTGDVKVTIEIPSDLEDEGILPLSLVWLSSFKFFVIFGEPPKEDEEDISYDFKTFIITHDKTTNTNTFQESFDAIPSFGEILRKPTVYSS